MRLGFYISGKAGRFNKILGLDNAEMLNAVKVVFSDDKKTDYLKEKLSELGIPYILLNYKDIPEKGQDKNLMLSDALLKALKKYEADYCFSFGDHLLKGMLLEEYRNRIINFHPSLLPLFPGRKAIDQALEANTHIIGNTAHFIDQGIDTGPIILQSVQPVKVFYQEGYDGILDIQLQMYKELYRLLKNDRIKVQDNNVYIEGADYGSFKIFPEI